MHADSAGAGGRRAGRAAAVDGDKHRPYVALRRGSTALMYGGPSAKRGDPGAAEYVHLAPGESRQVVVDLAPVFDLRAAGRYHLQPQITLHDVVLAGQGAVPRARALHTGRPLACPALDFTVGN
jgi:hypothetical protein